MPNPHLSDEKAKEAAQVLDDHGGNITKAANAIAAVHVPGPGDGSGIARILSCP